MTTHRNRWISTFMYILVAVCLCNIDILTGQPFDAFGDRFNYLTEASLSISSQRCNQQAFTSISSVFNLFNFEIAWSCMLYTLAIVFNSHILSLRLVSLTSSLLLLFSLRRISGYYYLPLLIVLYPIVVEMFTVKLRMGFAFSVIMFSIAFLQNQSKTFGILLSCSIHNMFLFLVPCALFLRNFINFTSRIKFNYRIILLSFIIFSGSTLGIFINKLMLLFNIRQTSYLVDSGFISGTGLFKLFLFLIASSLTLFSSIGQFTFAPCATIFIFVSSFFSPLTARFFEPLIPCLLLHLFTINPFLTYYKSFLTFLKLLCVSVFCVGWIRMLMSPGLTMLS